MELGCPQKDMPNISATPIASTLIVKIRFNGFILEPSKDVRAFCLPIAAPLDRPDMGIQVELIVDGKDRVALLRKVSFKFGCHLFQVCHATSIMAESTVTSNSCSMSFGGKRHTRLPMKLLVSYR